MTNYYIDRHGRDDPLSHSYQHQYRNQLNCDFSIGNYSGQEIRAHRQVIGSFSSFFKNVFEKSHMSDRMDRYILTNNELVIANLVIEMMYYGTSKIASHHTEQFKAMLDEWGVNAIEDCNINGKLFANTRVINFVGMP